MADNFTPMPVKTKASGDIQNDMTKIASTAVSVNSGNKDAGTQRVVIATDQPAFAVTSTAANVLVDNAAFTDGTSSVGAAGYILDETPGTALTENDIAAARIDSKRAQVLTLEDATTRGQRAAISAAGRLSVDASGVAIPLAAGAAIIGALTANQSVNVAQVNGVTTQTGTGVAGTGTQRVAVASDSSIILAAGSATIGSLTANQSVNTAQIGAATVLAGNGVTGTGSQRVTIASDNTPFFVKPTGADGAAIHSVTNPVWSKLTDGTNALGTNTNPLVVTSDAPAGTVTDSGLLTSAALAAGGSANLDTAALTTGTPKLLQITASSSVRIKVEVQSGVAGGTAHRTFFVEANTSFVYEPVDSDSISFSGGASKIFRLKITNMDNANAADVYGSITHLV